jgi:hypothetical protein
LKVPGADEGLLLKTDLSGTEERGCGLHPSGSEYDPGEVCSEHGKKKAKFTLLQAMKAQRMRRDITLLFL